MRRFYRSTRSSLTASCRSSSTQQIVPCTGRGGPASTSGQHAAARCPTRAPALARRGVQSEAAAVQPGGLGYDLRNQDVAEPVLTPRRIVNRRIKSCLSPAQLSSFVLEEVGSFDQQNASHALSKLAKMYRGRQGSLAQTTLLDLAERDLTLAELRPAVEALTKRMHQLIGSYDSWDTTLSLWAYAQLDHYDETALRALSEAALAVAPIFKPADCANAVVAYAHLDYLHPELLRQIVTTVMDTLDDFQPSEICQVLWGFGRMGCHPGVPFLLELVDAVQWRVEQYGTQELVMVLWSLVRLNYKPGPRFLRDVEDTLLQRLPHMVPADICVSVWSFAHLRYKAVRLMDEAPQALGPRLHTCKNSELVALMSGYATAHHYHQTLLDAVAGVVLSRLESLSHQEVCVTLWTYGTFRHRPDHPDFGKQLATALYNRMPHFVPQGLAMVVKALAQLQWRSEPLLAELIGAAEQNLNAFKPLELSQLLWGLTALQCKDLSIYYSVVRRCIAILKDPQHPHYRTMMHHRVVNSIIVSCQQLGYVPWTLIDYAESKGIRVKQPDILSSRDDEDEGIVLPALSAAAGFGRAEDAEAGEGAEPRMRRGRHVEEEEQEEDWDEQVEANGYHGVEAASPVDVAAAMSAPDGHVHGERRRPQQQQLMMLHQRQPRHGRVMVAAGGAAVVAGDGQRQYDQRRPGDQTGSHSGNGHQREPQQQWQEQQRQEHEEEYEPERAQQQEEGASGAAGVAPSARVLTPRLRGPRRPVAGHRPSPPAAANQPHEGNGNGAAVAVEAAAQAMAQGVELEPSSPLNGVVTLNRRPVAGDAATAAAQSVC